MHFNIVAGNGLNPLTSELYPRMLTFRHPVPCKQPMDSIAWSVISLRISWRSVNACCDVEGIAYDEINGVADTESFLRNLAVCKI
jgi:hypothetical protein